MKNKLACRQVWLEFNNFFCLAHNFPLSCFSSRRIYHTYPWLVQYRMWWLMVCWPAITTDNDASTSLAVELTVRGSDFSINGKFTFFTQSSRLLLHMRLSILFYGFIMYMCIFDWGLEGTKESLWARVASGGKMMVWLFLLFWNFRIRASNVWGAPAALAAFEKVEKYCSFMVVPNILHSFLFIRHLNNVYSVESMLNKRDCKRASVASRSHYTIHRYNERSSYQRFFLFDALYSVFGTTFIKLDCSIPRH